MKYLLGTATILILFFDVVFGANCWITFQTSRKDPLDWMKLSVQLCRGCLSGTPRKECKVRGKRVGMVFCKMRVASGNRKHCQEAMGNIIAQCINKEKQTGGMWEYDGEIYDCTTFADGTVFRKEED